MERLEPMLSVLRCPYSGVRLRLSPVAGDTFDSVGEAADGAEDASDVAGDDLCLVGGPRPYRIVDGVPWLLLEERVADIDHYFQRQYGDETARKYDAAIKLQSLLIGCWEPAERRRMVELLDVPAGSRVLEVAVGTGANLPFLSRRVGPDGQIVGVDLSMAMIRVAQHRAQPVPSPVHFVRADACHLPFADDTFDAVFHFGGLNMFGDVGAALREMVRVAKPGAAIVVGDEGMSEARRRTRLGRFLGRMNNLNLCRPPFSEVPWDSIEEFELHWAWREIFYVMRFRKAAAVRRGSVARENVDEQLDEHLNEELYEPLNEQPTVHLSGPQNEQLREQRSELLREQLHDEVDEQPDKQQNQQMDQPLRDPVVQEMARRIRW